VESEFKYSSSWREAQLAGDSTHGVRCHTFSWGLEARRRGGGSVKLPRRLKLLGKTFDALESKGLRACLMTWGVKGPASLLGVVGARVSFSGTYANVCAQK
jgi:hypothetical protein